VEPPPPVNAVVAPRPPPPAAAVTSPRGRSLEPIQLEAPQQAGPGKPVMDGDGKSKLAEAQGNQRPAPERRAAAAAPAAAAPMSAAPVAKPAASSVLSAAQQDLWQAAQRGEVEAALTALGRGALIDGADAAGRTALMYAALRNDEPMVKALLSQGASLKPTDKAGLTALQMAQQLGASAVVPLLEGAAARR
jgi:Ankyrin repeats (3 copies)